MRNFKRFLFPIFLLTSIGFFIACTLFKNTQAAEEEIAAEKLPVAFAVEAAYAQVGKPEAAYSVRGQIEAAHVFALVSEAEGKITHSAIVAGRSVAKGQHLLSIDQATRLANQKIHEQALRKAHLDYEIAKSNQARYKNLLQSAHASTIEYENAQNQLDAAEVQVRIAEQQLESAKIQVAQSHIYAPAAGIIVEKKVKQGDYVQAGMPLGLLAENTLIIRCFVPENIALQSKIGDELHIQADALPKEHFKGNIKSIVPYPNEAKLYPIEISLPHSPNLMAGLGVQVFFAEDTAQSTLLIPRSALLDDFKKPSVFVINAQKQAEKKPIRIGKPLGQYVEVLEGLQEKDLVITKGHHNVAAGKTLTDLKIVR